MPRGLHFTFERGDELIADFLEDLAPNTVNSILDSIPAVSTIFHTRWCGREIYTPVQIKHPIARENQTSQVSTGDVSFWQEWEKEVSPQVLSLFYGPESIRYITGPLQVNVFARISQDQWPLIERIGSRVWLGGIEKVTIELV